MFAVELHVLVNILYLKWLWVNDWLQCLLHIVVTDPLIDLHELHG